MRIRFQCQQRPWYSTEFSAGTADTLFQQRWHRKDKLRPKFEVLHIGDIHELGRSRAADDWMVSQSRSRSITKGKFAAFMNAGGSTDSMTGTKESDCEDPVRMICATKTLPKSLSAAYASILSNG